MAGQMLASLDVSAAGSLHDAQLDYYGRRAAVASTDGTVFVYDVAEGEPRALGQLKGHEGAVWKVSWAHPKFGSLIATCGYDKKVIVWKEVAATQWQIAYMDTQHEASVNCVEFCPWEFGLRLACASSDGMVSVLTHQAADQQWRRAAFQAHGGGAQTLSWMPPSRREMSSQTPTMRLASGGCDNAVRVWRCDGETWTEEQPALPAGAHGDWVRGVAWRPDCGTSTIATGGWDRTAAIWAQHMQGQPWHLIQRIKMSGRVEGLAWSMTGGDLSVCCGDGETSVYKEGADGRWEEVGKVGESGLTNVPNSVLPAPPEVAPSPASAAAEQAAQMSAEQAAQQKAVLDSFGMM